MGYFKKTKKISNSLGLVEISKLAEYYVGKRNQTKYAFVESPFQGF